ncbi:hypothetical protein [Mycobacterium leprae]|nr:hypothetical protein [Mycobacterium leprae]
MTKRLVSQAGAGKTGNQRAEPAAAANSNISSDDPISLIFERIGYSSRWS